MKVTRVRIVMQLFEKIVNVHLANRFAGHKTLGVLTKRWRTS